MKLKPLNPLSSSRTISFADVAHQTLLFDQTEESSRLILELIDTSWMQRLRKIKQTGNTHLVYMFAEHSRFGHSLGVAYLANVLMKNFARLSSEQIAPYKNAVAAAALLHDLGHVAPGSHLAEHLWSHTRSGKHEQITIRIISEDPEIQAILKQYSSGQSDTLSKMICSILAGEKTLPPWTTAIISGGGWNADRGNWAIVDSAMCSVSYGRYNVLALIDAFRISDEGHLVIQENRLDALTHFFVARDSMYRQVYQHRTLQAADMLTHNIVRRIRELMTEGGDYGLDSLKKFRIFTDSTMLAALNADNYAQKLTLAEIFNMTEHWWSYHIDHWCEAEDKIVRDLSQRIRDRKLFKTIRIETGRGRAQNSRNLSEQQNLIEEANKIAADLGYDPRYYVNLIDNSDKHRESAEEPPLILLDNGQLLPATEVEPMIATILARPETTNIWLAVPKEVKDKIGRIR